MDIMNIQKACEVYKSKHGAWPPSLLPLIEMHDGEAALLKEEALIDPWRRPYHYGRDRLDLETGVPLIWSEGSDPADPDNKKIANWPRPPEPSLLENPFAVAILVFTAAAVVVLVFAGVEYRKNGRLGNWVVPALWLLALGMFVVACLVFKKASILA
jgi:hypothetical protein